MRLIFVILSVLLLFQSCDKCKDVACSTPPGSFRFKVVDKKTGENLFTNGTYDKKDLQIINLKDNSEVEFVFLEEGLIRIGSIGWKKEVVDAEIKVSDTILFNFYVDAERVYENCCDFTRYNEERIYNCDFKLDTSNGMYSILVGAKTIVGKYQF